MYMFISHIVVDIWMCVDLKQAYIPVYGILITCIFTCNGY